MWSISCYRGCLFSYISTLCHHHSPPMTPSTENRSMPIVTSLFHLFHLHLCDLVCLVDSLAILGLSSEVVDIRQFSVMRASLIPFRPILPHLITQSPVSADV